MVTVATGDESPLTNATFNGELSSADYWDDEPKIFSAGMGFDNIIGVNELTEEAALELAAPGTSLSCAPAVKNPRMPIGPAWPPQLG